MIYTSEDIENDPRIKAMDVGVSALRVGAAFLPAPVALLVRESVRELLGV